MRPHRYLDYSLYLMHSRDLNDLINYFLHHVGHLHHLLNDPFHRDDFLPNCLHFHDSVIVVRNLIIYDLNILLDE